MSYDKDNIFAKIIRGEAPAFTVYEDDQTIAILDVMPQADGHTLVIPKAPARDIFDLDDTVSAAVFNTVRLLAKAVDTAFEPDGIRVMQFNRAPAGQSVFHFHMHIVPCYEGVAMRKHGSGMADSELLEAHANKLKAALV